MKRFFAIALALTLALLCGAAWAEIPVYSVNEHDLYYDWDNDAAQETIRFTAENDPVSGLGKIVLSVQGKGGTRTMTLLEYALIPAAAPSFLLRLFPTRIGGANYLYAETHALGVETLYSSWRLIGFDGTLFYFPVSVFDPGYTSQSALIRGLRVDDPESYPVYTADHYSYSQYNYLLALKNQFVGTGIPIEMGLLPFAGSYTAPMAQDSSNGQCALSLTYSNFADDTAPAAPSGAEDTITLTGDSYLRVSPDVNAARVTVLKKGAKASYLGESRWDSRNVAWHYVRCGTYTGWVSSKYAPFKPVDSLVPKSFDNKVNATGDMHVRADAGTNFASLGVVKKGQTLSFAGFARLDERGVVWFAVNYGGKMGWASSKYAKLK